MLTDTQLKNIKAIGKLFKVADRDGLYIAVTKTGQISGGGRNGLRIDSCFQVAPTPGSH